MEPQSAQAVYEEIAAHMKKQGGPHSSWYVGITSDWETCLFEDHLVPRHHYWCAVHKCYYDTDSRSVAYSLLSLGCDGEVAGDEDAVYVYAYLKGEMTKP
jgi:hypothetical protein